MNTILEIFKFMCNSQTNPFFSRPNEIYGPDYSFNSQA